MLASADVHQTHQQYNRHTDVLVVTIGDAEFTVADDTPSGFTVHYAVPSGEAVGVTVLSYCERFGGGRNVLHVDAPHPFDVAVEPLECGAEALHR